MEDIKKTAESLRMAGPFTSADVMIVVISSLTSLYGSTSTSSIRTSKKHEARLVAGWLTPRAPICQTCLQRSSLACEAPTWATYLLMLATAVADLAKATHPPQAIKAHDAVIESLSPASIAIVSRFSSNSACRLRVDIMKGRS